MSELNRDNDEIDLVAYWRVVLKYKKMIASIVVAVSIFAVILSLSMTSLFKAEAVIMPVSSKGGGLGALASQFGGLAALAGVSASGGLSEAGKLMAILRSRSIAENVITRENLMPVLFPDAWDAKSGKWKVADPKKQPSMESAISVLKAKITSTEDKKTNTIRISGVSTSPEFAARLANMYVDELQNFINANALTMSKRNRIFIEGQLETNKRELLEFGKEINDFYKGNRVSASEANLDVPTSLKSMITTNDPENGDDANREPDLETLLTQKAEIDKKMADAKVVKDVPQQVYLAYLTLRRELLAKVNALLTTQYEMAKIDEAKEDLAFQIIDKAVAPEKKFAPRRAHICMMYFFASLVGAVLLAFLREYLKKMKASD